MFSLLSAHHSVHRGQGSHMTITHDALDLHCTDPPPLPNMGSHCTGTPMQVTSGGQDRRPAQTCSPEDLPPLVATEEAHRVSISGRYASYWNAFLFVLLL